MLVQRMSNYIKGVGTTSFGIHTKQSHLLAYDAILDVLKDTDMDFNKIDAIVVSNLELFYSSEKQRHFASLIAATLKTHIPIIRVPAACAGGGTALWTANRVLTNDEDFNNILVLGVEKLMETTNNTRAMTDEFMMAAESRWEQPEGVNFPCSAALVAQQYLKQYPETTMDDLALISLKNHENAYNNKIAYFYKKKVTLEQIKSSPVVCSPLRLFDCSISLDGAASCILTKDKTDIELAGSALSTDYLPPFERDDLTSWTASTISSKQAYEQAGITPEDLDVVEVHDAFSIVELISYEDLGFCKKGQAYKAIRDGRFKFDGKLPVNLSGGLKARGHPVSATGIGQIYELTKQLRKESHLQLDNPKIALAQNIGGAGGTITCNVLKKIGGQ